MKYLFQWMKMLLRPHSNKYCIPPIHTKNPDDLKCAASNSINFELKKEDVSKLTVAELRIVLGKRGLSKNWLKKVLQDRLIEGIEKKIPLLQDRSIDEVANDAGDGFAPGTFWNLLEPEPSTLGDSIRNIDGVHFRAPIQQQRGNISQIFVTDQKKRN